MKIPFFRQLSPTTHQVLEILSDGEFHSGLRLARDLQISRIAIWKIIKKLEYYQLVIEKHRRKGYQLQFSPELFSEKKISALLPQEIQDELEIFSYDHCSLSSDFSWAIKIFEHRRPLTDFSICLLESQGVPPSPLGKNIDLAIGISLFSLFPDPNRVEESITRSMMSSPEKSFLVENLETHVKLNAQGKIYLIILQIKFIPIISSRCSIWPSQDFHRNKFVALFLEHFYRAIAIQTANVLTEP